MDAPRSRPHALGVLAMGFWLASRGALAKVSLALAVLGACASIVAAMMLRGRDGIGELPAVAAMALAWGTGATLAFGASFRALRRDRDDGVLALARARGIGTAGYVRGRVGGLALLLAFAVGGATLVAGLAATATAGSERALAVWASAGALVYALAFAATFAPLAMAALSGRTRAGSYVALLVVLVLPELASAWTRAVLPAGWHELTSIPAALDALRVGVQRGGAATVHALRAAVGLAAVAAASLAFVHARIASGGEPVDRAIDGRERP